MTHEFEILNQGRFMIEQKINFYLLFPSKGSWNKSLIKEMILPHDATDILSILTH